MAGTALPLCLILAAALWGGQTHRPGPPFLRLQRLEEQVRRLREVTLNHLQSIARNYNISYNIDGRFQALAEQAEAAASARAALGAKLARLATAGRRLHRRLKRLEGTVGALRLPHLLVTPPPSLPRAAWSWGSRLERELQGRVAPSTPSTPSSWRLKARREQQGQQEEGHGLPAHAAPGGVPGEDVDPPRDAAPAAQQAPLLPTVTTVPQAPAARQPGEGRYCPPAPAPTSPACLSGAVLLFPNTSQGHTAVLGLGSHRGLRGLSLCSWLATPAPRLGALLSYTSGDGGSELSLSGGDSPGSARLVLGGREFRELPVVPLLDGRWHHLCLTWSSGQGQYRFYVDRRLLAAGSGFQRGYEIPTGGLLVLGGEQDGDGRGLGAADAFVGGLAGFALWSRALLPGEVARMAMGRLPRGPLLRLAGASPRSPVCPRRRARQREPCPVPAAAEGSRCWCRHGLRPPGVKGPQAGRGSQDRDGGRWGKRWDPVAVPVPEPGGGLLSPEDAQPQRPY
ncbi:pentraxin-4 [Apus apus]|uniref:pentraxin-4 n=1 Tax=Apus apus TaxID=8895 RepID=UPI0021F8FC4C|nr:pentraxin-4 [Apus apus]